MKKDWPEPVSFRKAIFKMSLNQNAFGRYALSVRIVTQLSVTVQQQNKRRPTGKRIHTLRLSAFNIVVRRLESGEEVIVLEPP
jgi:hypothetical protein